MAAQFVHLHVHSEYSMLDGAIRLKALAKRVKELGQSAVALTDHGNMHGTLQFQSACASEGIKSIVGCEVNLVTGSRKDHSARPHGHLVLLAESQEGYANLSRIVSLGWVDGLAHGVPRVDLEALAENTRGVIAMTACMGGHVAQEILLKGADAGKHALGTLKERLPAPIARVTRRAARRVVERPEAVPLVGRGGRDHPVVRVERVADLEVAVLVEAEPGHRLRVRVLGSGARRAERAACLLFGGVVAERRGRAPEGPGDHRSASPAAPEGGSQRAMDASVGASSTTAPSASPPDAPMSEAGAEPNMSSVPTGCDPSVMSCG